MSVEVKDKVGLKVGYKRKIVWTMFDLKCLFPSTVLYHTSWRRVTNPLCPVLEEKLESPHKEKELPLFLLP